MDPGDAIIWDRNLFHRGDPFNEVTEETKMRYTIRYVPSNATAAGFHHPSVNLESFFAVLTTLKFGLAR
jgi:hypothetical protein